MRPIASMVCLACGELIEETLYRLGSPRCLDCRDARRPLDPRFVADRGEPGAVSMNGHGRTRVMRGFLAGIALRRR